MDLRKIFSILWPFNFFSFPVAVVSHAVILMVPEDLKQKINQLEKEQKEYKSKKRVEPWYVLIFRFKNVSVVVNSLVSARGYSTGFTLSSGCCV